MSFLIFVLGCILKRQCSRLFLQYEDQRYYFRVRVHKIAAISCKPLIDISTIMLKINLMGIFKVLKNSELLFFFISYTRPRTLLIIRLSVRRFSRYPQKMQFECSRFHIAWQKSCCAFVVVFSFWSFKWSRNTSHKMQLCFSDHKKCTNFWATLLRQIVIMLGLGLGLGLGWFVLAYK